MHPSRPERGPSVVGLAAVILILASGASAALGDDRPASTVDASPAPGASVQALAVEVRGTTLQVPLRLAGRPVTLVLRPHRLRAPGFVALRIGADGVREELPAGAPATYRGELIEEPGSVVAASVRDGRIRAAIRTPAGEVWLVQPHAGTGRPAESHAVYAIGAHGAVPGTCGASAAHALTDPSRLDGGAPPDRVASACSREAEIAFEVDYPLFVAQGGTTQASLDDVEALLNAVEVIYAHDVRVSYALTTVVLQTTPAEERYAGSNQNSLLGMFQSYWQTNFPGVPRDLAHLLTGRAQGGNIVGVAFLGTVCLLDYAYGWSQSAGFAFGYRVGVTSHELGHNWGAFHCDGQGDCSIMCSIIGACSGDLTRFGAQSKAAIAETRDLAACLSPGNGAGTPVAPTVVDDFVAALIDQPIMIDVLANDFDGNCDPFTIVSHDSTGSEGGTVMLGGATFTFTPAPGFEGSDTFQFVVEDATGRSSTSTTTVTTTRIHPGHTIPYSSGSGVDARYYESPDDSLPEFDSIVPYHQDVRPSPSFGPESGNILGSGRSDHVGVVFEGFLVVDVSDLYRFHLDSDDGSRLVIDGIVVVDNDGAHGFRERSGFIGLAADTHAIRVEYFEAAFDAGLFLSFEGGGQAKQPIPPSRFLRANHWVPRAEVPLGDPGNGQAAAWGDYDGDGDEDLYVADQGANRLLRNTAGDFTDVTAGPLGDTGDGRAAAWGDYDRDGDLDLYLANADGPNRLFRNDGASFTSVASGPLAFAGETRDAAWADFDRDGDLDLFLANGGATPGNLLLRNDGGSFVDATPVGMAGTAQSWAAAWGDADGDGDPDLYVVNDGPDRFFRNQGGGTFVDATAGVFGEPGDGRAAAWGDYDNDQDLDLLLVNATTSRLFRNDGGSFLDTTSASGAGVAFADLRGVAWIDADNDGDLDLFYTTGTAGQPKRLLLNSGGAFSDATAGALGNTGAGRAAAWSDFDRDGDLDVHLVNTAGADVLLENHVATGNRWLELALVGVQSNRSGIGARVRVTAGGVTQIREIGIGSGTGGKASLVAHVGLGASTVADQVQIRWPSGAVQTLEGVSAGQRLAITEMNDAAQPVPQTIQIDGVNDFNPGNLLGDDRGDAFTGNDCPGDPALESPLDLGRVYVTNDAQKLYFGFEYDRDCFCDMNLGLAIDVNTAAGGTTDPFGRKIAWTNLPKKPDFYLYDVVPTPCNGYNYEVLYRWNVSAWQALTEGSNGLAIADGVFTEGSIPLATLGVGPGDTLRVELFVTQEGATKGPLDALCSDAVQLSTPTGTVYDVATPVQMTCMAVFVVLAQTLPVPEPPASGSPMMLEPASPNPFRGTTGLDYRLPSAGHVRARVFDIAGRERARLLDGVRPAGRGHLRWDGLDLTGSRAAAGIYFVTLEANGAAVTRRVVRLE